MTVDTPEAPESHGAPGREIPEHYEGEPGGHAGGDGFGPGDGDGGGHGGGGGRGGGAGGGSHGGGGIGPSGRSRRFRTPKPSVELLDKAIDKGLDGADGIRADFMTAVANGGVLVSTGLDALMYAFAGIVRRRFSWTEFFEQCWFLVSVTLLPAILIAFPIAFVIVLEVGTLATSIGASQVVGAVDGQATIGQIAPIVAALLLSGAGGTAMTADLGARNIRDELAALEVMGIDPVERLVAPRVLATVVISFFLNWFTAFVGIMAGYLADVTVLNGTSGGFLGSFSEFSQPADVFQSIMKSIVFGLFAATIACYKGMNVSKGAAGVGEAVKQSVVINGICLFLADVVITQIFLTVYPLKSL